MRNQANAIWRTPKGGVLCMVSTSTYKFHGQHYLSLRERPMPQVIDRHTGEPI